MLALIHNQVLVTALVACFLAQGLKLVVEVIQHQRFNLRVLVETGGMPSSHSARWWPWLRALVCPWAGIVMSLRWRLFLPSL